MGIIYSRPPQNSKEFCIMKVGIPNKNGRTYERGVVIEGLGKFQNRQGIHFGTFMDDAQDLTIPLDKVSHIIENVELRGNRMFATIKPINTPHGEILEQLMEQDLVEFRTSGTYSHLENGCVRNWTMISVNVVMKGQGA